MKKRIAILASGGGSNFEAVVCACERGSINGDVVLLIYDRRDAFVRERAKKHGIEAVYMNRFQYDKDENRLDSAMLDTLKSHNIDLIVLAGYISKVGKSLLHCLNVLVFLILFHRVYGGLGEAYIVL